MTDHINKACNAAFYHLHNLRRIRKYLSRDSLITLVHAFITSRLDYCNCLWFGLPKVQIAKLQRVQNAWEGGGGGTGGSQSPASRTPFSRLPYLFVPLSPDSRPLLCFSRYLVNDAV